MNKWLLGEIELSLHNLYKKIPFGGLGTFYWMKYFKGKKYFHLIGCEADFWYTSFDTKLLRPFISTDLYNNLPKLGDDPKHLKKFVKTLDDQYIYESYKMSYLHKNSKNTNMRYVIWCKNIVDVLYNHKLFVNGYHFEKSFYSYKTIMKYVREDMLTISMATCIKELPIVNIKLRNEASREIHKAIIKFFEEVYPKMIKTHDYFKKLWKTVGKYKGHTKFEHNHKTYEIVKIYKDDFGYISMNGVSPILVFNDNYNRLFDSGMNVNNYDYVIFIPISKFNKNMYA